MKGEWSLGAVSRLGSSGVGWGGPESSSRCILAVPGNCVQQAASALLKHFLLVSRSAV